MMLCEVGNNKFSAPHVTRAGGARSKGPRQPADVATGGTGGTWAGVAWPCREEAGPGWAPEAEERRASAVGLVGSAEDVRRLRPRPSDRGRLRYRRQDRLADIK
jgi:hypothetical protein